MSPEARVEALLAVARRIADRDDALGREARDRIAALPQAPSPAGIDLALAEHLETAASPAEIARLIAWAPPASSCAISLAANVCTAALRAIALGLAASPRVLVKPSRRDPVLAELLAREAAALDIAIVEALAPAEVLHLYGSDETLAAIALPPHRRAHRFGSGFGVAWCTSAIEAEAVARDLVAFDGAGCLSPRLVIAPHAEAEAVATALHVALARWGERIPRAPLDEADRAALRRVASTYAAVGAFFSGEHHAVAFDPAPQAIAVLPPLRAALVVASDEPAAAIAPHRHAITCVGGDPPGLGGLGLTVRRAPLGRMQRPPLDGPVDLRG